MAASKKFTPRASSNLIEEEVTENKETVAETPEVEEVAEVVSPEEVEEDVAPDTPEEKAEEVTFNASTEKKPIERMVKIRLAKKYDGCIGGIWYHFAKDQVVNVPENVKRILNSAEGMLKPL